MPPIFKKDDSTDPGNYCPVSILSVPRKLLESEIKTAIINHVTCDNLVTPNQWAYRKAHSTELLLIYLTEKWRRFVDDGLTVAVAFVDSGKLSITYYARTYWTNYADSSVLMVNFMLG